MINQSQPDNSNSPHLDVLRGIVYRVTFHSADSGWSVLKVDDFSSHERITVTVHQTKVFAGSTMVFHGQWSQHPKFGLQFKATNAVETKPATSAGLERYLGSGLIHGVGPKTAKKIVAHFGKDTLEVFENEIHRVTEVPGIAQKKLVMIQTAWETHQEIRNVMIFLQSHGISTLFAVKIFKKYGNQCITKVSANPYCLADDIFGIGFFSADKVALSIGFSPTSLMRISAGIKYTLANSREMGHCYLTKDQIIAKTNELLQQNVSPQIEEALITLNQENQLIIRTLPSKTQPETGVFCYYSKSLYYDEKYVADWLQARCQPTHLAEDRIKNWIDRYCAAHQDVKLSDEQSRCIVNIANTSISILTGGPGCGKTTTTKILVKLLLAMKKKVDLCAPTGRAAQRMTEVIEMEAKTIHRMLTWQPAAGKFKRCVEDPLTTDFLIVDECSMLDITLMAHLLKSIPAHAQVLFIGDSDQLPSVGAGNVLKDMIGSPTVPCFHLTKIFRQAANSRIIQYAHKINNGQLPNITSPFAYPDSWKTGEDCLFIDSDEATLDQLKFIGQVKRAGVLPPINPAAEPEESYPVFNIPDKFRHVDIQQVLASQTTNQELQSVIKKIHPWSSLRFGLNASEMIRKLYTQTIPKYFPQQTDIQILSPMTKGSLGTFALNKMIQQAINPPMPGKQHLTMGDRVFRVGDRVIQKRNNYDLGVFNGDIGSIHAIDNENMQAEIIYPMGGTTKCVQYEREALIEIDLAYAITIHKSQGSEFQIVILPIMTQHFKMLFRNLIYTGLTRAKTLAIFVGARRAMAMAVKNIDTSTRQTALAYLLSPPDSSPPI